ncbi:MAG: hypothetical protein RR425_00950 [Erysipelotrichales bacterium]
MSLYLKRILGYAKIPLIIFLITIFITASTIVTLTNNKVSDNIQTSITLIYTISLTISAILSALYQYNIYLNDDKELFYLQGSSLRKIQFLVPIFAHYILFILLDIILVIFMNNFNVKLDYEMDSFITLLFATKYIICAMILFFYTLSTRLLDFVVLLVVGAGNAIFIMKIIEVNIIAPFLISAILILSSYIVHYIKRRFHLYDVIEFIKIVTIVTLFITAFENILISGELYKHSMFSFNFNGVILNYGPLVSLIIVAIIYNYRRGDTLFSLKTLLSFIVVPILCGSLILVYKDQVYLRAGLNSETFNVGSFGIRYSDNRSIDIYGDDENHVEIINLLKKKAESQISSNKIEFIDYNKLNNESKVVISDYQESNFIIKERDFKRVFKEAGIKSTKTYVFNNINANKFYVISDKQDASIDMDSVQYGGEGRLIKDAKLFNKLEKQKYGGDINDYDDYQLYEYYIYQMNGTPIGAQAVSVNKKTSRKELKNINKEILDIISKGGK